MASDTTYDIFQHYGTNAQRLAFTPSPAAGIQPIYIWYETDTGSTFVFDSTWHALGGGGTGTVTNTGALTANELVIGNGTTDEKVLGTLGTTTTVLHGNAGGAPTFAAVDLAADVTGDLPFASFVQASAASKLVGRGSAAGAGDFQEITLGTNLTMSGTTLNASGSGGGTTDEFAFFVG